MVAVQLRLIEGSQKIDRNDEAKEALRLVRLEVYNFDAEVLARRVGCSVSTINAFRSGRTIWPRPATLFAILDVIGYKVCFVKRTQD